MRFKLAASVVALGLAAAPAYAQKSADTIRIVLRDAVTNIDPYYNQLRTAGAQCRSASGSSWPCARSRGCSRTSCAS